MHGYDSMDCDAPHFHYEPYELLWHPSDNQDPVCVHGELYTLPAFLDAHKSLQESPPEPSCTLPRIIVALMFWSNGTQLTNFRNAKLWPLYMFFGNESKYRWGKQSCNLGEHVAYFESVCYIAGPRFCSYCVLSYLTLSKILSPPIPAKRSWNGSSSLTVIVSSLMLSGRSCWMKNFWWHTNMGLSSSVMTMNGTSFILVSSPTWRTILKSEKSTF